MGTLIQIVIFGLMVAKVAGLLTIIGFVIYAEFFDDGRFSVRDYLTPEEMEMALEAREDSTGP